MEAQLHHPHDHPADGDLHEKEEHGVEKKSSIEKVKAKVHKLKATIKHGHGHGHHDDEHHNDAENIMNESPPVRSGLVEPTDMGKAVLVEDFYATHYDIMDTPVRSFAQWEEEERRGSPPPLPTGIYGTVPSKVGHHGFNRNVNREQLGASIGKTTGVEEHASAPKPAPAVSLANRQTEVAAPTTETGLSQVSDYGFNHGVRKEEDASTPKPTTEVSTAKRQTEVPAPKNTGMYQVGHRHGLDKDQNSKQFKGGIGKSTGMVQDPSAPNLTTAVSPANYQTKVTDPTNTGGKEAGITDVLRSFNKMAVYNELHSKSSESNQNEPKVHTESHDQHSKSSKSDQTEPKVYTGSHDQFAPEPVKDAPLSTVAKDPLSHTQELTSATSDKAATAKDSMVSKLGSSGENKSEAKSPSFPTDYAHKVADTVTGTLGPVYETVVGVGSSVMSKMQGSERPETTRITEKKEGGSVKDYLVEKLKPSDEDKVVSDVITNVFHRNDPPVQEVPSTSIYVKEEGGEGRSLQESGN